MMIMKNSKNRHERFSCLLKSQILQKLIKLSSFVFDIVKQWHAFDSILSASNHENED